MNKSSFPITIHLALFLAVVCSARAVSAEDWPMARGNLLRNNRAAARGAITGQPAIAWRLPIGCTPGATITADFDGDGSTESYAAENWRVVRRDQQHRIIWKSEVISRNFTLVGFEDLDGDGQREPLMEGSGLNVTSPVYFVFDPHDGRIRWRQQLLATNGGDLLFGALDPSRKGMQLARALFPNPGEGALEVYAWDKGVENGYRLWSWKRSDDHIYFPQLALGDFQGYPHPTILMLSHMCVRAFDVCSGQEIGRVAWGNRSRSYGGYFGVWPMKPAGAPSILVVSAFHRITVIDQENTQLVVRWDHAFDPDVGDTDLKGEVQFLPDGVCDLDGDGWTEIVVSECPDEQGPWRVLVLNAQDGTVSSELNGYAVVGSADLEGDQKCEVFLRRRGNRHDGPDGPVQVARWLEGTGLSIVWTDVEDSTLIREPQPSDARFSWYQSARDQVKLGDGTQKNTRCFFVRDANGQVRAFEANRNDFVRVQQKPPPDRNPNFAGSATAGRSRSAPLVADLDTDGRNELIQETAEGQWTVFRVSTDTNTPATSIRCLEGLRAAPLFADLDGDGFLEIITVRLSRAEDDPTREQVGLEVLRADGSLLWSKRWPADFVYKHTPSMGGFAIPFVSAGHFTQKDAMDLVISYTGERTEGRTSVLDGRTGATVWDIQKLYPTMYGSCWDAHPPVVFDYDGDGLDDLATVCQTVHYTILSGTDGKQLLDKPRSMTGQPLEGGKPLFANGWSVGAMLGGAKMKGEDLPALAVLSSQGPVGVFHPSGEAAWFINLAVVDQVSSPGCWADTNGDGTPEVVYIFKDGKLVVFDAKTGAARWKQSLDSLGSLLAADIDGDGCDEVLFSSEKGILYCLSEKVHESADDHAQDTHVQWTWEFDGVPGAAIFADVSGDDAGEILVPVSDGFLYALTAAPKNKEQ